MFLLVKKNALSVFPMLFEGICLIQYMLALTISSQNCSTATLRSTILKTFILREYFLVLLQKSHLVHCCVVYIYINFK